MLIADYRVTATTYLLTHAAYSFRSLHRALLMVKKNSDPGNRKWETFGWSPPTLGPPSFAPNSGGGWWWYHSGDLHHSLIPSPFFTPFSSRLFPFSSKQAPLNAAGRSGERCKRPQRSLGRCACRNRAAYCHRRDAVAWSVHLRGLML